MKSLDDIKLEIKREKLEKLKNYKHKIINELIKLYLYLIFICKLFQISCNIKYLCLLTLLTFLLPNSIIFYREVDSF